jgi:hypothetical protein
VPNGTLIQYRRRSSEIIIRRFLTVHSSKAINDCLIERRIAVETEAAPAALIKPSKEFVYANHAPKTSSIHGVRVFRGLAHYGTPGFGCGDN